MDKPIPIRARKRKKPQQPSEAEQAIRAIASVLEYATDHGNEPLEGFAALGLARLLEKITERMR